MRAPAAQSDGARLERAAFRAYLRRLIVDEQREHGEPTPELEALHAALLWVLSRQRRYDRRPGGLGRR